MNWIDLQETMIAKYGIKVTVMSPCWQRTHIHIKTRMLCKWKQKNSYDSTFILFHEIGHVMTTTPNMKRCEKESEATRWAVNQFRELGIPIRRKVVSKYKKYVRMSYERGVARGLQKKLKSTLYM